MTSTKKKAIKDYSNTIRVFDKDGYRKRADCICFKDVSRKEVLLVSSRNFAGEWTIPGGGVEPMEMGQQTAAREALEEGGVIGEIDRFVGTFDHAERRTRTEVYTMVVGEEVDSWQDKLDISRQRKWFVVEEALSLLRRKPLKHRYFKEACSPTSDRNSDTNEGSCVIMQNEETRNLKERHYFLDCQS